MEQDKSDSSGSVIRPEEIRELALKEFTEEKRRELVDIEKARLRRNTKLKLKFWPWKIVRRDRDILSDLFAQIRKEGYVSKYIGNEKWEFKKE